MKKKEFIFISHLLDSISKIEDFMQNVTKEKFDNNEEKQSAVIRQIEIMGEAVKNLPLEFKKQNKEIEWTKITGTRDRVIHHYFGVDLNIVWEIIKKDLPDLKKKVQKIKEKLEKSNENLQP